MITIFLFIKAATMTVVFLLLITKPMLVAGDAIQEFLESPDESTLSCSFEKRSKRTPVIQHSPLQADSLQAPGTWDMSSKTFYAVEDDADVGWFLFALATIITQVQLINKVPQSLSMLYLAEPQMPRYVSTRACEK